jgi:hypothetical protein
MITHFNLRHFYPHQGQMNDVYVNSLYNNDQIGVWGSPQFLRNLHHGNDLKGNFLTRLRLLTAGQERTCEVRSKMRTRKQDNRTPLSRDVSWAHLFNVARCRTRRASEEFRFGLGTHKVCWVQTFWYLEAEERSLKSIENLRTQWILGFKKIQTKSQVICIIFHRIQMWSFAMITNEKIFPKRNSACKAEKIECPVFCGSHLLLRFPRTSDSPLARFPVDNVISPSRQLPTIQRETLK